MSFWCKIGWHGYNPVKVFFTTIIDAENNNMPVGTKDSWTGYVCRDCGKRKIKKTSRSQSAGATQNAFDWLNERPVQSKILKLVK